MSDADPARPALRQLLWIAAGVAVLTLLVVAASWLFSPRHAPGDTTGDRGTSPLKEEQVRKDTFAPEAASSGSSPMTESTVQKPTDRIPEQDDASPDQAPSVSALPLMPQLPLPANPKPALTAPALSETLPSSSESPALSKGFAVQVGAFSDEAKAREVASRLKGLGYTASVLAKDGRYKVLAKGFADRSDAEKAQAALAKAGIRDPFIVPVE